MQVTDMKEAFVVRLGIMQKWIYLAAAVALVASLPASADTSLLRNGSFSDGLSEWMVPPEVGSWSPLTADLAVRLSPPVDGFRGTVLYQNLNVGDVGGREFHLYFWLRKVSGWTGSTVGVYAEYIDSAGELQRSRILAPSTDSIIYGDWTVFSHLASFPTDASRLVKLSIAKEGYGVFDLDGIMLLAEGVVPVGLVPRITTVSPTEGESGTMLTIDGTNFGSGSSGNDSVLIDGSPDGISILSWTNSRIVVRVDEGSRSGRVSVLANGVESNGDFSFTALSPYLALEVIEPSRRVIRGQTATFLVRAEFTNGFTAAEGATFVIPEAPAGSVNVAPAPIKYTGGATVNISTSGLSEGTYRWNVQAVRDGLVIASAPLTVQAVGVSDVEFYTRAADGTKTVIAGPLNLTRQQRVYIHSEVIGTDGLRFPEDTGVSLTSDHLYLHVFPMKWGGSEVYVAANLSAHLTANCADGFSKSIAVTSSVSSSPMIQSMGLTPGTVTNKGDQTMTYVASATASVDGGFDYSVGTLVNYTSWWTNEDKTFNATGQVPEALTPGTYLYRAWIREEPVIERVRPLTVVNDPARGVLKGSVHSIATGWNADPDGVLELYDESGAKVTEFAVAYWGAYTMPYVAPGTYRLRFLPRSGLEAQWYPNCYAFAVAEPITVTAGLVVDSVDFFIAAQDVSPPSVARTDPLDGALGVPRDSLVTAVFSKPMDVDTIDSSTFQLESGSGGLVNGAVTTDGVSAVFAPTEPLEIGQSYTATVTVGVLDTGGRSMPSPYSWIFTVGGNSLSDMKTLPDGSPVSLSGKGLYYVQDAFGYISEADRSSGIRIEGVISATVGDEVLVTGTMATTAGGERFIAVESMSANGTMTIRPLGANIRTAKSPIMGGLHVSSWGRVVEGSKTANGFVITDGSDVEGLRVVTVGIPVVQEGDYVVVTGAAGYESGRVIYSQ